MWKRRRSYGISEAVSRGGLDYCTPTSLPHPGLHHVVAEIMQNNLFCVWSFASNVNFLFSCIFYVFYGPRAFSHTHYVIPCGIARTCFIYFGRLFSGLSTKNTMWLILVRILSRKNYFLAHRRCDLSIPGGTAEGFGSNSRDNQRTTHVPVSCVTWLVDHFCSFMDTVSRYTELEYNSPPSWTQLILGKQIERFAGLRGWTWCVYKKRNCA